MHNRNCFNGGEWSPQMDARADLETYARGCRCMENWELNPEGGVKNRKGFGKVAEVMQSDNTEPGTVARLFGYVYSQSGAEGRYVVVVSRANSVHFTEVKVYGTDGALVATLSGGAGGTGADWRAWLPKLEDLRVRQVNSLLFLLAPNTRPWVLKRDAAGTWSLEAWKFKNPPWRYTPGEDRDEPLIVRMGREGAGTVTRRGGWYTATDSQRSGGTALSVPTSIAVVQGSTELFAASATSGQMKQSLVYAPLPAILQAGDTVSVTRATRSLYANSAAVQEARSALSAAGIVPPAAQSLQVPGRASYSRTFSTSYIYQTVRLDVGLEVGAEVTLYAICIGNAKVSGLSGMESLWAPESGAGFTQAACPTTAGNKLHLLRVRGRVTGERVQIAGLQGFLWCGVVAKQETSNRTLELDFSLVSEEGEGVPQSPQALEDFLRVSYITEQRELRAAQADVLEDVQIAEGAVFNQPYSPDSAIAAGTRLAFLEHEPADCPEEIYSCITDFNVSSVFVEGLDSPANYTGNFAKSTRQSIPQGVAPVRVYSLKEATGTITKGKYVALVMQSWRYYTVRKDIAADTQFPQGPEACPEFFAKGLQCGDSAPCRGAWSTYTSGVWYGEYAVKRNFDSGEPLAEGWETVARTASRIGTPANKIASGTEKGEECYISLWLLSSRCMDANHADLSAGFPGDSCENRLVVEPFRRDLVFSLQAREDGSTAWVPADGKLPEWEGERQLKDWSWWAFSPRYGGPVACDVYAQRLVFAGTHGQPQTLWASKTDDLDNFALGQDDADALELTLATTSQNPICWIQAKGDILLLGTGEAEYSVASRAGGAFTASTASARPQSYIGSADLPCIQADNRVLFLQRGGRRLYEIGYDFETDGYVSRDLTLLAAHIGRDGGGFLRGALAKVPYTTAFLVMADGTLALLAYNPLEQIKGWHRWRLACNEQGNSNGVLDVCVLPNPQGDDEVYILKQFEYPVTPLVKFREIALARYGEGSACRDHMHDGYSAPVQSRLVTLQMLGGAAGAADKQNQGGFKLCLGKAFTPGSAGQLSIGRDGAQSFAADRGVNHPLKKGWNDLAAPGGWREEDCLSITADAMQGQDIEILAVQG